MTINFKLQVYDWSFKYIIISIEISIQKFTLKLHYSAISYSISQANILNFYEQ